MISSLRVILVKPPHHILIGPVFPSISWGHIFITYYLKRKGFDAYYYNGEFSPFYLRDIIENLFGFQRDRENLVFRLFEKAIRIINPDVVVLLTSVDELKEARMCSRIAKKINKSIILIEFGTAAKLVKDYSLYNPFIDFIIKGNIENLHRILKHIAEKKNIKVLPREYSKLEKDKLVLFSGFYPKYALGIIRSSFGCPFECSFCIIPLLYKRKYSTRSVKEVIKEILDLKRKYGIKVFGFEDENFGLDKKWLRKFCKEIKRRKIKIKWSAFTRVDTFDTKEIKMLKSCGCYRLYIGIESGSQRILDLINKKINIEKAKKILKELRKCGIEYYLFFMYGYPFETLEDLRKTIKFALNSGSIGFTFTFLAPFPGTPISNFCKGKIDYEKFRKVNMCNDNLSNEFLQRIGSMMKRYSFKKFVVWNILSKIKLKISLL